MLSGEIFPQSNFACSKLKMPRQRQIHPTDMHIRFCSLSFLSFFCNFCIFCNFCNFCHVGDVSDVGDVGDVSDAGDVGDVGDVCDVGDVGSVEYPKGHKFLGWLSCGVLQQ